MAEGSQKLPALPTESFTRESFYEIEPEWRPRPALQELSPFAISTKNNSLISVYLAHRISDSTSAPCYTSNQQGIDAKLPFQHSERRPATHSLRAYLARFAKRTRSCSLPAQTE